MPYKLLLILLILFSSQLISQSKWCDNLSSSSVTSFVYIADSAYLSLDGVKIPFGSYIVGAINRNNVWECAGQTEWTGSPAVLQLRGMDASYNGFNIGDSIRLFIVLSDGCIIRNLKADFEQNNNKYASKGIFQSGGKSLLKSIKASSMISITSELVNDTCNLAKGKINIKNLDGFTIQSVKWSTSFVGNPLTNVKSGNYSCTITDETGCKYVQTYTLKNEDCTGLNAKISGNGNSTKIAGCPPLTVSFLDSTFSVNPIKSWKWNFSSGNNMSALQNPQFVYNNPGNYTVSLIVDDGSKKDTAYFEVEVLTPQGSVMADTSIVKGNTIKLQANGGQKYRWEMNSFPVSDSTISNPDVTPANTTTYQVSITDINGCESKHQIKITVKPSVGGGGNNPTGLVFPNILTLNGDAKNDQLIFDFNSSHTSKELYVFDRWGKLVYENKNYNNDWPGTMSTNELNSGTYYYLLKVNEIATKSALFISK